MNITESPLDVHQIPIFPLDDAFSCEGLLNADVTVAVVYDIVWDGR